MSHLSSFRAVTRLAPFLRAVGSNICSWSLCGWLLTGAVVGAAPATAKPEPAATNAAAIPDGKALFDGKSLKGWKVTDFAGHGEVTVDPNFRGAPALIFEMGAMMTGVTLTNPPPQGEFEVSLEAMKIDGTDFFCALTFPAGGGHCSLIVGGWGGGVVGISSVDSMDASENETTKFMSFEKNRWYKIRVRVTKSTIEAWIDDARVVNLITTDRRITVRPGEIELNEPFGLAAYETKAALRNIRVRNL
jgi:hypothetical protein